MAALDLRVAPARFISHVGRVGQQRRESVRIPANHLLQKAGLRHGALPDYLVIGAMKAGSTTFYDWLVTHPLVPRAATKEVHFFDSHFREGLDWYKAHLPTERQRDALSREAGHRALVGEATPNYVFHPLVPRRVSATVPDAKLIVLLRDPVGRAYSHYNTNIRHDWEALSFEEALAREEQRLDGQIDAMLMDEAHHRSYPRYRWSYAAMGRYAELLERWFTYFPREQFLFVLNWEMDRDPDAVFKRVWDFLDLPYYPIKNLKRRTVGKYEPMRPDTRERLREYFRPHNERLAELIGLDLGWD